MYLWRLISELRVNIKSRIKSFYKKLIFRLSASNNLIFIYFYRFFYKPAPGSIDDFADKYSRTKKSVTLVQVGANDGINNDPIHKFIKRDGWKGVLLEPQRFVFNEYLLPLYSKTKGIIPVNAALEWTDGMKPIYRISASNSRWAHGLTTFNRSVLEESVRSGYVTRQLQKEGSPVPEKPEDFITEEMVECISADTLKKRYNLDRIDWLQIDTEGYDFEIIRMFTESGTKPEVIVYENLHFTEEQKNECTGWLERLGYRCKDFGPNTLATLAEINNT